MFRISFHISKCKADLAKRFSSNKNKRLSYFKNERTSNSNRSYFDGRSSLDLRKCKKEKTIIPKGKRAYSISLLNDKSLTLILMISNKLGIVGYNYIFDTVDRWI